MPTRTSHFVDITPMHTHIVLLSQMQLLLSADHARAMTIDGVHLPAVAGNARMWQWHTYRRIGHHVLVIDSDDGVQVVTVECVDASTHQGFVGALRDSLAAIDPRLCIGQSAWQTVGLQRATFESLLGMTCESFLRLVLRVMHTSPPQLLQEWQGDTSARMRLDRVVVRDATVVPLVNQSAPQRNQHGVIAQLVCVVDALESKQNGAHSVLIQAIRQHLLGPVAVTYELADVVRQADMALARSRQSFAHGEMRQTADVAMLYERWVWVSVLTVLGCDVAEIPGLLEGNRIFVSDTGVYCAYQRRLAPILDMTGWSRDGRIAIPDVMLWQMHDAVHCRALIIDAKCSLTASMPDATAYNDVTAYLRRIGMGTSDPDAAVLVHPGSQTEHWPSGLMVVGTRGVMIDGLIQVVQQWVNGEI
jgi:hypothetical protein